MMSSLAMLSTKKETKKGKTSPKKSQRPAAEIDLPSAKATPLPSKLKRFRISVPSSMDAGDLMTIKLDNILTKILITAPTTTATAKKTGQTTTNATKSNSASHGHDQYAAPPSPTMTSCSNTTTASSFTTESYDPTTDKYAITTPTRNNRDTSSSAKTNTTAGATSNAVIVSTDIHVPEGKRIMEVKPVVVVHAVFPQTDKALKDSMVDEVIKLILQETLDCGGNAILGMTISIKEQKTTGGFLVKASGTPCLLLPVQVLLSSPTTMTTNNGAVPTLRPRTSSVDDAPPLARRQ